MSFVRPHDTEPAPPAGAVHAAQRAAALAWLAVGIFAVALALRLTGLGVAAIAITLRRSSPCVAAMILAFTISLPLNSISPSRGPSRPRPMAEPLERKASPT